MNFIERLRAAARPAAPRTTEERLTELIGWILDRDIELQLRGEESPYADTVKRLLSK